MYNKVFFCNDDVLTRDSVAITGPVVSNQKKLSSHGHLTCCTVMYIANLIDHCVSFDILKIFFCMTF